jgi:phage baseplate assembly protein W
MSISLVFPLEVGTNGFQSYSDSEASEAIKQNLKMLLLTNPGEYVMDLGFGVGLSRYLFENASPDLKSRIKSSINLQVASYMPYLRLLNVEVDFSNIDSNSIYIRIEYRTPTSLVNEFFDLTATI